MKSILCALCVILVAGCASDPKMAPQSTYMPGGCQPIRADSLMKWAKELGGDVTHARSASVTQSSNVGVECRSEERAASQLKSNQPTK